MPDVQEVFRMATQKVRPDPGALERQQGVQRRHHRRERAFALAVGGGVVVALIVAASLLAAGKKHAQPAESPSTTADVVSTTSSLFAVDPASGAIQGRVAAGVGAFQADVSPDGSRIVFSKNVAGHQELFVANVDGSHASPMKLRGDICSCGAVDPDWSPDGRRIAFVGSNELGGSSIDIAEVATGNVTQLTKPGHEQSAPDWSPDGSRLVFVRGGSGPASIVVLDVASGSVTVIVKSWGAEDPVWSPDGNLIAYSGSDGSLDVSDLWLVRADGSAQRRFVDVAKQDLSPAWSPDGRSIAFTAFNKDASPRVLDVVIVELGSKTIRVVGHDMTDPAWSPDGDTLFVRRYPGS
jgi:Tol biopolymer transport system component